ncbi:MAG: hypothetical protein J0H35_12655, partial [Rhodospirillales bacterium]|nr:hypothetical protein [Rhodospirillales bacterium]
MAKAGHAHEPRQGFGNLDESLWQSDMHPCLALAATGLTFLLAAGCGEAAAQNVARGKYLVDQVGMCGDCHTPRDATGQPIMDKRLTGAPIGFRPTQPMPFADHAPSLVGVPAHYTPAQFAT